MAESGNRANYSQEARPPRAWHVSLMWHIPLWQRKRQDEEQKWTTKALEQVEGDILWGRRGMQSGELGKESGTEPDHVSKHQLLRVKGWDFRRGTVDYKADQGQIIHITYK